METDPRRSWKDLQAEVQASGEQFVIDEIDTLKAVADPLRLRILMQAQDDPPVTVKAIAAKLRLPQTRLYYHVKLLEKHGFIRVAARRVVSGIEERSYEATATNWTVSARLASAIAETGLLSALMDVVAAELAVALSEGSKEIGDPEGPVPALTYTRWFLTAVEVEDIQRRLHGLMEDYGGTSIGVEPGAGRSEYNAFLVVHRRGAPGPAGDDERSPAV